MEKIIEIPEGVSVKVEGTEVTVKHGSNEIKRKFNLRGVEISVGKDVRVFAKKATKREFKLIGTAAAHIKNMVNGVKNDFVYTLEICNVHFPMNVKVDGKTVVIKTFLGEVNDRIAAILPNVEVEVKGKDIIVSSFDKDAAGQTAANIEKATKITGRDRRVFQDGIFITEKCGKAI